jgi:thymidylate synthase (FAD)
MQAIYENHYLTDDDVANYARQSFGKLAQNFTKEQNNNLVKFLARGMASGKWEELLNSMENITTQESAHDLAVYLRSIPEHWIPFAHPHITLRMGAPVPIRTQCFKHKIGFVESEESRRYISSTPVVYIPEHFRSAAANVKQGSAGIHPKSDHWLEHYKDAVKLCVARYEHMIADGVCPEQARFILPQGTEVNWVWTGSLYAFANFYNQRSDSHAQQEIQDLAEQVDAIIAPLYPISWAALTKGEY